MATVQFGSATVITTLEQQASFIWSIKSTQNLIVADRF